MMTISLIKLHEGDEAKVESIAAGKDATKRLYEMGLNTKARISVLKNDFGPVLASVNGNKIAIGRGLAEKVMVQKTEKEEENRDE
jgi:ferrous iron transport protein A